MKKYVDINNSSRRHSFEYFANSIQPITSITSVVNIKRIQLLSKHKELKFNAILCFLILKSCQNIKEFYYLVENIKDNNSEKRLLIKFDSLCLNLIVKVDDEKKYFCDIPYDKDFNVFYKNYIKYTVQCKKEEIDILCDDKSRIATSCLPKIKIIGCHNQYSGVFNNVFLIWGKYDENGDLPISFNFHHLQMDGNHVQQFFLNLQKNINNFKL